MNKKDPKKEEVRTIIKNYLRESNKLPCSGAFELYYKTGIPLHEIGEVANELKIKITNCQLGCFK